MWEALYGKDSSRKKVFTAAARPQFITVLKSQGRRLFSQFAELRVDGGPKSGEYSVEGKLLPTCRYCCLSLKSFRNQELLQRPYNNGVKKGYTTSSDVIYERNPNLDDLLKEDLKDIPDSDQEAFPESKFAQKITFVISVSKSQDASYRSRRAH